MANVAGAAASLPPTATNLVTLEKLYRRREHFPASQRRVN